MKQPCKFCKFVRAVLAIAVVLVIGWFVNKSLHLGRVAFKDTDFGPDRFPAQFEKDADENFEVMLEQSGNFHIGSTVASTKVSLGNEPTIECELPAGTPVYISGKKGNFYLVSLVDPCITGENFLTEGYILAKEVTFQKGEKNTETAPTKGCLSVDQSLQSEGKGCASTARYEPNIAKVPCAVPNNSISADDLKLRIKGNPYAWRIELSRLGMRLKQEPTLALGAQLGAIDIKLADQILSKDGALEIPFSKLFGGQESNSGYFEVKVTPLNIGGVPEENACMHHVRFVGR